MGGCPSAPRERAQVLVHPVKHPMIQQRLGSLLEADAEALVNTVNCVGVMGKGVALQFKLAFPDNFDAYRRACLAAEVQPGRMFVHERPTSRPRYIINFPTKRHWKEKSKLADIDAGLVALRAEIENRRIRSVAVPPLGCGNGGLEWAEVEPLIRRHLSGLRDVSVLVHPPGTAPGPEDLPSAPRTIRLTRVRASLLAMMSRYQVPGYDLGRVEVQKLAYFLQVAGAPLGLRFTKGPFGPYSEVLNHVLLDLEGNHIRGYGERKGHSSIHVLPRAEVEAMRYLAGDLEAIAQHRRVASLIEGFESPYGLELLATVHWVGRQHPEATRSPETAVREVHAWSAAKRAKFPDRAIRIAWQRLHEQGWWADSPRSLSEFDDRNPTVTG